MTTISPLPTDHSGQILSGYVNYTSQINSPFSIQVSVPSTTLFQEMREEIVLVNLQSECYYSLNKVGSQMWQLLSEHGDVETACQQLLKTFTVDEPNIRQDLAGLVDELVQEGLLTVTANSSTQQSAV